MVSAHGTWRVRTDKIPVLEVEAVELVASRFCVHHVLIDDKGSALAVVGDTLADLAVAGLVTQGNDQGVQHACAHAEEDDVPHRAELAKEIEEFLWGDVEAATGLAH